MDGITKAIDSASDESHEVLMGMAKELGKLTPIPVPDYIFRHASHALGNRLGKGDWQRIYLYAPVGVWMESEYIDAWLKDLTTALHCGQVKQCWGVYGLPPKSEAAAWHAHGDRRLNASSMLITPNCTTSRLKMPATQGPHAVKASSCWRALGIQPTTQPYSCSSETTLNRAVAS